MTCWSENVSHVIKLSANEVSQRLQINQVDGCKCGLF